MSELVVLTEGDTVMLKHRTSLLIMLATVLVAGLALPIVQKTLADSDSSFTFHVFEVEYRSHIKVVGAFRLTPATCVLRPDGGSHVSIQ